MRRGPASGCLPVARVMLALWEAIGALGRSARSSWRRRATSWSAAATRRRHCSCAPSRPRVGEIGAAIAHRLDARHRRRRRRRKLARLGGRRPRRCSRRSSPFPLIILYPLLMAWLGIGPMSKIVFGVFSGFFPIVLNTIDGVRAIEPRYLTLARAIGATRLQTYARMIFPLALPAMVSGLRVGTGLVVIGVIVTEMLASLGGVGFLISYHRTLFNTGHVYFGMLLALVLAVAVNVGLTRLDRRIGSLAPARADAGITAMAEWMIGVDTGGTFTDLVAFETRSGELRTIKVPSVPADPSTAVTFTGWSISNYGAYIDLPHQADHEMAVAELVYERDGAAGSAIVLIDPVVAKDLKELGGI